MPQWLLRSQGCHLPVLSDRKTHSNSKGKAKVARKIQFDPKNGSVQNNNNARPEGGESSGHSRSKEAIHDPKTTLVNVYPGLDDGVLVDADPNDSEFGMEPESSELEYEEVGGNTTGPDGGPLAL